MTEHQQNSIETIVNTVSDLIKSIEDPVEKGILTERIIWEVINWGLDNFYEQIGMLEKIKIDYWHTYNDVMSEEEDDEDE